MLRQRPGDAQRLLDVGGCSVVIARRRHGAWHGPIAGFRVAQSLRQAWLVELLDVDVCPWRDEDAARYFDGGVAAVLDVMRRLEVTRARRRAKEPASWGITLPAGLGGPRVQAWLDEHGREE